MALNTVAAPITSCSLRYVSWWRKVNFHETQVALEVILKAFPNLAIGLVQYIAPLINK